MHFTSKETELLKHRIIAASYRLGKADLGGLFDRMDSDHSGEIDLVELNYHLRRILPTVSKQQIEHLMQSIDLDGNEVISKDEFIEFLSHRDSENQVFHRPGAATGSAIGGNYGRHLDKKKIDKAQLRLLQGSPVLTRGGPKFRYRGLS